MGIKKHKNDFEDKKLYDLEEDVNNTYESKRILWWIKRKENIKI